MSESTFLIFWIILLFFIPNFLARVGLEQNSGVEFFSLFLGLSHHVLAKNNAINWFFNFLIFWIFLFYFFGNFLARVEYERNSVLKFFSPFRRLSHPILAKNNAGNGFFFYFFNFFYFFWNFLGCVECERKSWLNFFSLFLYYPILAKNNAGKGFFYFLYFLAFFFGISLHGSRMNGIQE